MFFNLFKSSESTQEATDFLKLPDSFSKEYLFALSSELHAGHQHITTRSETLFSMETESNGNSYEVLVKTGAQSSECSNPLLKDSLNTAAKLNSFMDEVIFELTKEGALKQVLNKKHIIEKWEVFRKTELPALCKTPDEQHKLEHTISNEFNQLEENFNANFLHKLLFAPIYNSRKVALSSVKPLYKDKWQSRFMDEYDIPYTIYEQVITKNDQAIMLNLNGKAELSDYLYKKLKEDYDLLYRPDVFGPMNYNFTYKSTYQLQADTGIIESIEAEFFEQICEKISYSVKVCIEKG